ncbi:MAG: hypothetical protein C0399_13355 [Syntrophus sp. (in: bacteria)]|nr:hypothetical protein [Syntrophus sp. (in: bacteria)]
MIKSRIEDSQYGRILTLDGELCIQDADEFRALLLQSIDAVDALTMNVASVTDIDLSCLQLLCAAHRTAIKVSKRLELDKEWPESFARVIGESGYARHDGCSLDKDHGCLWIKEHTNG